MNFILFLYINLRLYSFSFNNFNPLVLISPSISSIFSSIFSSVFSSVFSSIFSSIFSSYTLAWWFVLNLKNQVLIYTVVYLGSSSPVEFPSDPIVSKIPFFLYHRCTLSPLADFSRQFRSLVIFSVLVLLRSHILKK